MAALSSRSYDDTVSFCDDTEDEFSNPNNRRCLRPNQFSSSFLYSIPQPNTPSPTSPHQIPQQQENSTTTNTPIPSQPQYDSNGQIITNQQQDDDNGQFITPSFHEFYQTIRDFGFRDTLTSFWNNTQNQLSQRFWTDDSGIQTRSHHYRHKQSHPISNSTTTINDLTFNIDQPRLQPNPSVSSPSAADDTFLPQSQLSLKSSSILLTQNKTHANNNTNLPSTRSVHFEDKLDNISISNTEGVDSIDFNTPHNNNISYMYSHAESLHNESNISLYDVLPDVNNHSSTVLTDNKQTALPPTISYPHNHNNNHNNNNNNHHHHHHHNNHSLDDTLSHYSHLSSTMSFQFSSVSTAYATTLLSLRHFKSFIGGYQFVAPWAKIKHISTGYRINYNKSECLHSLGSLHNETCNVYTHILGFILFIALGIYRYNTLLYHLLDENHYHPLLFWTFITYYIGTACCMILSAIYHLYGCISEDIHTKLYRLDMTGVIIMIVANFIMPSTVTFYCFDNIGIIYMIASAIGGLLLIMMQNMDYFQQDEWYCVRISSLVAFSGLVFIPYGHYFAIGPFERAFELTMVIFISVLWYLLGLIFWIFKIPEVFIKDVFDLGLYSHGLWHASIIIASLWTEQGFIQSTVEIIQNDYCPAITTNTIVNTFTTAVESNWVGAALDLGGYCIKMAIGANGM